MHNSSEIAFYDKFVDISQLFADFIYKRMIPRNNQEVIDLKQRIQNNLARIEKENQNNQTTHEENTNKVEGTKANVNIDADSVVVNNNNPITDDEFFDDFFGDE